MSDQSSLLEGVIDPGEETELEIKVLGDDEVEDEASPSEPTAEKNIALSQEEYAKLVRGSDGENFSATLERLGDKLSQRQAPAAAPVVPKKRRNDEEVEADVFKPGQTRSVVADIAEEVVERMVAPQAAQYNAEIIKLNKRNLELDSERGPLYKRYKKEIDDLVESVPAGQRVLDIFDRAFTQVIATKAPEIAASAKTEGLDEAVNARLKEMGFSDEEIAAKKTGKLPGPSQSLLGPARVTAANPPKRTVLRMTESDVSAMARRGLDPKDSEQVKSYLDMKKARGGK